MSLREKLRILSQGIEGLSGEELAADWRDAVSGLFTEIRGFVSDYETDNLLSVSEEQITVEEPGVGTYSVPRLALRSGRTLVRLTPIGRVVAGAIGRVDLTLAENPHQGYMLLRQGPLPSDWQIAHRQNNPYLSGGGSLESGVIVYREPLTKASFEQALEELIR